MANLYRPGTVCLNCLIQPGQERRRPGSWLGRWLAACADLEELFAHHQLLDAIIEEVDGRRIRVGDHWLIDYKTIWDDCVAARAHGATLVRYAHDDPEALERALRQHPKGPRLVAWTGSTR